METIFETTDPTTLSWLAAVVTTARDNGQRVRLCVERDNEGRVWLKAARAGGMWSAPIYSDRAPNYAG